MNESIFKMLVLNDGVSTVIAYLSLCVCSLCTIIKIGWEHSLVASFVLYVLLCIIT